MFVDAHIVQQQQHHEANIIHKAAAEHHHLMEFGRIWVVSSRQTLVSLHTHRHTDSRKHRCAHRAFPYRTFRLSLIHHCGTWHANQSREQQKKVSYKSMIGHAIGKVCAELLNNLSARDKRREAGSLPYAIEIASRGQ